MDIVIKGNTEELDKLEAVIQKDAGAFYEIGCALMEIRDKGLYHDVLGFETFEQYCRGRWDMGRFYAYRLIDSAKVVENVDHGQQKPTSERQCRPLARLAPDKQRIAWQQAVETAPAGKVTAAVVSKVVKGMMGEVVKKIMEIEIAEESAHLSNLKTMWNVCNKKEKAEFIKWINDNFNSYFK